MLLLLFHPGVSAGPGPGPAVEPVIDYGAPGAGGARYPQERYLRRKKLMKAEDEELLQLLAVVLPLIEGRN